MTPAIASPASVSMIGLVTASSAAMLFARFCTSATAAYMRLRIVLSRLNDLTMRAPNTVSCITRMIIETETSSFSMMRLVALQKLVDGEYRGRPEDEGDKRQHRLLDRHHQHEADQREQVADERRDEYVDYAARRVGALRHAHDQVGRGIGMIELDAVLQHAVVDLALPVGDDRIAGAAEKQRLDIGGDALDDEDRRDRAGDQIDRLDVLGAGELVGDVAHDPGARGCRGRHDQHGHDGNAVG